MAKGPKKPRQKSPKTTYGVHVEVLQNGATMLSTFLQLKRHGAVALTAQGRGPLVLPHYPLPQSRLEFARFTAAGFELEVDHKWEGFCTTNGELRNIAPGDRGRRTMPMKKGDYASITVDDLRVMIKLAPPPPPVKKRQWRMDPAYRKGFITHFFATPRERLATVIGGALAAIIVGGGGAGLLMRQVERPRQLVDVSEEYILPFVAPAHLRTAPEALQMQLDRKDEVRSVLGFYSSFTAVLMGWKDYDPRFVYATSVDLYQHLHDEEAADLRGKVERQTAVDVAQAAKPGVGLLTIPAVLGESMSGSMLRVIDKIDVMQRGLAEDLAAKRDMLATFPKDPEYSWGEYKNIGPVDDHMAKILGQIKVFNNPPDEQIMYAEAEALAARAKQKQARVLPQRIASGVVTPESERPIALPDGVTFASFTGTLDFRLADDKLLLLQGSEFGTARPGTKHQVREPLVGEIEPGLIEGYIKENRFQLQLCYELALRRNEAASGTMEWHWRIDSRGSISDLALVSSSIPDTRMTECIRQKISQWRFPRPRRGSVEVSYPFEFAPAKG